MTATAPSKKPTISKSEITKTIDGYRCKALVTIGGQTHPKTFLLLVPVSAYEKIKARQGQVDPEQIESLLINRIRQSIQDGVLGTVPPSTDTVDLGTLDDREVDGLL